MKKLAFALSAIVILAGCGKKSSDNPNPGGGTTTPAPAKALLTSPAQNEVCTTGTVISDTKTSVSFTWNVSANTNSYDLIIENLLTNNTTTQNTSATTSTVTLLRNTPYSWYVVSKSAKTSATSQSDTWKFYVAGLGTISYAPFPASITSPTFGQEVTVASGMINLIWTGSDADNDIVGYDVYFDTNNSPSLFKSGITDMFLNNVSVSSGKTYYWKVITKDSQGNTSDSGVYQFSVD
jgi:hypothetical protein